MPARHPAVMSLLLALLVLVPFTPATGKNAARIEGASAAGVLPRWWEPDVSALSAVEGHDPLTLFFTPNARLCRQHYGDDGDLICGRSTGLEGRSANSLGLAPTVPGSWRWQWNMGLTFQPDQPWPADTPYTVVIPPEALPEGTTVTQECAFRTRPVTARINGDFKFDPHDPASMGVSGVVAFNYPMDPQSVRVSITSPEGAREGEANGVSLGQPELVWAEGNNLLSFSVPVRRLADRHGTVRIDLHAGARASSGGAPGKAASLTLDLPAASDLFRLAGAEITVVSTADLHARQALALNFSMPVDPAVVRESVKVFLLPRQKQAESADQPPYSWWDWKEITEEVRGAATPVTLGAAGELNGREPAMLVSFTLPEELEAGRALLVSMPAGLRSAAGMTAAAAVETVASVPAIGQDLRLMQPGAVLALAGEKTLSLYSRNLDAVTYEAAQVRPEFLNHLVGNWAGFSSGFLPGMMDVYDLSTVQRGLIPLVRKDGESPQFSSLDLGPMLKDGRKGVFFIRLNGQRDGEIVATDTRFVLVTDLGLIRKTGADGSGSVFVVSLSTGRPVARADVRVLGANGLPVFEARTNREGRVDLPSLEGLQQEKRPVALVAARGQDLAFLPLEGDAYNVNLGRFDVGGRTVREGGLLACMFGERDIYRPGETAHFGFLVRREGGGELADLPLKASVRDPYGELFAATDIRLAADGFGELAWPLPPMAATGLYRVYLESGHDGQGGVVLTDAEFMVEEFQPDTMRLTVNIEGAPLKGWLRPEDVLADEAARTPTAISPGLHASLQLDNLFGAPAPDHAVRAEMHAAPAPMAFAGYPGWRFHDATPAARYLTESLPQTRTDERGHASLTLPASFWQDGSRLLTLRTWGMDAAGGRAVMAADTIFVSPMAYAVGWKSDSQLSYLAQNGSASLEVRAIGPDLAPVAAPDLTLETVAITWTRTLVRDDMGRYRYQNKQREEVVARSPLNLPAEGMTLPLDLSRPGEWALVARDGTGRTVLRVPYVVAGTAAAVLDQQREPSLVARLSREDYWPGDEVEVYLVTPYKGAGLITVERDTVAASAWFESDGGDTVAHLRLPDNFEGKAYLNVLYFRALDDTDIFTRPMAATVTPFFVNMEGRDLGLELNVPRSAVAASGEKAGSALPVVRPGRFPVEVRARKKGRALVFAVDEGILQLTSYRTPDPLQTLWGDRALQVKTAQYFDLLMPEYTLMQAALSAWGGGEGLSMAEAGLNPFRRRSEPSAVFWSGLMEVGPDPVVVDIPTPSAFSGRMRVMAVACSPEGVSSARTDVQVRDEVVLQPSMPLFVSPGDTFEAVLALTDERDGSAATPEKGRTVRLAVDGGEGLTWLSDGQTMDVTLVPGQERRLTLCFLAGDAPGGHEVTFTVSPLPGEPGAVVSRTAGLSVRPVSPRTAQVRTGRISGEPFAVDIPVERSLYPHFAQASASASALPLPVAHGMIRWLEDYPYGCTEQRISAAFPALFLLRWPQYAPADWAEEQGRRALREKVQATLEMLQARYRGDGLFSVWSDGYSGSLLLSAYAADFLTTAEEMGLAVPAGFKNRVFSELRTRLGQTPASLEEARAAAYAAWALTRNGELTSGVLATLTAWLDRWQPGWVQDVTAAFMAGCWRLMRDEDEAQRLLSGVRPGVTPHGGGADAWQFDAISGRAMYLAVLGQQFPERLNTPDARTVLEEMLDLVEDHTCVTFSAAQASRALLVWCQASSPTVAGVTITALDGQGRKLAESAPDGGEAGAVRQLSLGEEDRDSASAVSRLATWRFEAEGPVWWQVESRGFDRHPAETPAREGMELSREFRTRDGEAVTAFHPGDEIVVAVHARSYGGPLDNVAIVDMLPGCFELVVTEGGQAVEAGTAQGALPADRRMDVDHAERREDRMMLFAALGTTESVFRYRVRVVARGDFALPPLYGEAMYDPSVRASGLPGRVVVE